jgi:hypothetical protein
MATQVTDIYKRRVEQQLCFQCGVRPQFWGKRCIICRQLVAKDPLPRGARAALRKYRHTQAQCSREQRRETIRDAGRELVARGSLTERQKEALQLYLGLEDNGWRTHGGCRVDASQCRAGAPITPAGQDLFGFFVRKERQIHAWQTQFNSQKGPGQFGLEGGSPWGCPGTCRLLPPCLIKFSAAHPEANKTIGRVRPAAREIDL